MKKLSVLFCFILLVFGVYAQLQLPPSGSNQKSMITQYMGGIAHVSITYSSPDVTSPQGASRKGQIWGQLVPYGLNNLNFGSSTAENPSPWRAGANENTIIEFSHDMEVQGKAIEAGKYGLHLIPVETGNWTLVLSNNSDAWGSYFYTSDEDALRVEVTPEATEYQEWLTYEFTNRQEENCTVALKWDELSIPFTITLPKSKEIYVEHLRQKMQGSFGFNWSIRNAAANYCLQNDVNLKEALAWQEATSTNSFIGNENVITLQTKAGLQMKLGMEKEAIATYEQAAAHTTANLFQIHQMGRQLIGMGQHETALKVFQLNVERNGDVWPVNVGLARAYSALGQYDKALAHAKTALERAPNQPNKDSLAQMIERLKKGEDVN